MTPSQKRKRPRRGRPANDRAAVLAQGDRIRDALNQLGLSQTDAATRSGIAQGRLSELISGKRAVQTDQLRKLGKIGVPPDYVLGLTDVFVPARQTRPRAELAADVAAFVSSRVNWAAITIEPEHVRQWIDGRALLESIADAAVPVIHANADDMAETLGIMRDMVLLRQDTALPQQARNQIADLLDRLLKAFAPKHDPRGSVSRAVSQSAPKAPRTRKR
jgi:transcriptional regulator with XRE-family HTH domain